MRTSVLTSLVLISCCLYAPVLFAQFSKTLPSQQMGTISRQNRPTLNQPSNQGEQMTQGATAEDILRQVNHNNPGYGMDPVRNQ